jgi:Xaa-Pro aminopeptidase
MQEVSEMDYPRRLRSVQAAMAERDIALMYLPRAANLFYLTGIRRHLEHGTDHNAYGDWLSGGYLGQDGAVQVLAPRMGGAFFVAEAEGKPWVAGVRLIVEGERPIDVLKQTLAGFGVTGGKGRIAVDERSWAQLTIALRELYPEVEVVNANEIIAPLRMIKDDDELAAMQRASDLTDRVFERALAALKPGVTEFEVAHEIDYQAVALGGEYTSFETGVFFITGNLTGGEGQTRSRQRKLQPGDSIMYDFGLVLDGYCSDFGRSAFLGEPPAEYVKVHDTVVRAQAEAMAAMVAGKCTAAEANRIARRIIADAGYDQGFTHRLGHGIGVTVHEPPFLDGVDESVLKERMTFTVEPSIILRGRFGNRVEDVVVVTEQGGRPLSNVGRQLYVID